MYRVPNVNSNLFYKEPCRRDILRSDVRNHTQPNNIWVIIFDSVYDLTELSTQHKGDQLMWPILQMAGKDISHWFDPYTGDLRTYIDPVTNTKHHATPNGRFVHVEPPFITTEWANDFGIPWWKDMKRYFIGKIAKRTCFVRFFNTLTGFRHQIEASVDDTILEMIRKHIYLYNSHSASYTCKYDQRILDLESTIEENNIPIETEQMEDVGLDPEEWPIELLLYFNDDLTVA